MHTPIIMFVSRHTPSIDQINIAANLGYAICHVGDFNAFSKTGEFEAFLKEKRLLQTSWDDTGVFGLQQRDVVVCVVHPMLALRAHIAGWTVVVFENTARPTDGQIGVPQFSNLHFTDPQYGNPHFYAPQNYVPPVMEERQILTDEERAELVVAQATKLVKIESD